MSKLKKKKILVTGGSGFLASHVADALSTGGHLVTIFDKRKSRFKGPKQKMIIGNILSQKILDKVIKGKDIVFHFAATADLKESNDIPSKTIENNLIGTLKVLEACIKNKVDKIIFASSIYALSEQGGFYSTSKLASEMLIEKYYEKYGLKYLILRFGTIYGTRANNFNTVQKYINEAKTENKITRNTKGNEIRSYIHIADVAKICKKLISRKYKNTYYNIYGNKKIKAKDLIYLIKKILPNTKIIMKNEKRPYNYVKTPFTYNLRRGKKINLKKYINLENGIKKLIHT